MSVQGIYWKHCIGCGTCPHLTTGIPQQCLSCRFEVLVNFGQVFSLFLGAFIVYFEYSLFIANVIKYYLMAYLCGTTNRRCFHGSCCKTLVRYLHRYLSMSSYDDIIFIIFFISLQFPLGKLAVYFTYCFDLLRTLSKFSQCFKV